jgi:hypothetical protein
VAKLQTSVEEPEVSKEARLTASLDQTLEIQYGEASSSYISPLHVAGRGNGVVRGPLNVVAPGELLHLISSRFVYNRY